jgi:hypothetical protein
MLNRIKNLKIEKATEPEAAVKHPGFEQPKHASE